MEKKYKVIGYWKFREKLPLEELGKLADEWAKDPNYEELHIRKTSSDQVGLGFTYNDPRGNTKEASDQYYEETSDILRRRFGNDLVGWDIGSWLIKVK